MQRTTIRFIATATLAAAAAFPVLAEGYGKGIPADDITNAQRGTTSAAVQQPQQQYTQQAGTATREAKRQEAIVALRRGEIPSGERSLRPAM